MKRLGGAPHACVDQRVGLLDDGARYYDPVAGQFTSADTTLAGGLNRYAYVDGSPETFTDPSGHALRTPDTGIGGEVGAEGSDVPSGAVEITGPASSSVSPGGGVSVGSAVAFGVVGGLFLLGAGAFGYAASQGFWITWQHWQAQHNGSGSLGLGLNVGAWVAHGVYPGIGSSTQDTGSSGSDLTRSVDVTSTESEAGSTPESAPQPAADGAGASQGGGGDDNCYCFWHGTNSESAESIIQNGIDPSKLSEGVFHITEGVETARDFAAAFPITEQRLILVEWPQASYDALVQSGAIAIEDTPLHEGSRLTQSQLLPGAWRTYNSLAKRLFEPDLETMRWREC